MKANTTSQSSQVSVFYDGNCPLCRREIAHYQKLDRANNVYWIDINNSAAQLQEHGLDFDTAMSSLHALDRQQVMQRGVKAFLVVWDALPYYRWLARFVRMTRTTAMLDWLYVRFARWRLARRSCDQQSCMVGTQTNSDAACNEDNRT